MQKRPHQEKQLNSAENPRIRAAGEWDKFPLFWFVLFLSYRCTRRCAYCYALNQTGDQHPSEMDAPTFARLLEWIPEVWRVNHIGVNVVNFLGGEPLLRTDRIKQVMDAVRKATDGMQGLVNTNGDLVDSVAWDDLEHVRWITINITDCSIEELARRMRIVAERSNVINQTIAATLDDDNLDRIIDVARFGIENGYRLRFARNLFDGADTEYKRRVLQKYHELCDLFEFYLARGYEVHTTFLIDLLIPLWDLDVSPYPCGKRIAAVFPDGSVGPCIRNHTFKTGTLWDDRPLESIQCRRYHFDVEMSDVPDTCKACESRRVCQGGCPHEKLLLTGTRSGRSLACDIHREIIPRFRHLGQWSRCLPGSG